jgi:hypothetical protein
MGARGTLRSVNTVTDEAAARLAALIEQGKYEGFWG